jgi:hypothetical protein
MDQTGDLAMSHEPLSWVRPHPSLDGGDLVGTVNDLTVAIKEKGVRVKKSDDADSQVHRSVAGASRENGS